MNRLFEKYPWLYSMRFLLALYVGGVLIATCHRIFLTTDAFNNFSIFRWSFFNLQQGNDLYSYHPAQHEDLFKYSPTFAFLMAPFFAVPKLVGIFFWNLLNALVPLWAVSRLKISEKAKAFVLLFIAIELLSSIQNSQSNGIMAGLMIGVFASLERKQVVLAALLTCLGLYIKVFGAAAGILFLFYDKKFRFLLACAAWGIVLAALPLIVTSFDLLLAQYKNWFFLLRHDTVHELNFSFMTLTQRWFNFTAPDLYYIVPGIILLLIPLARKKLWSNFNFRILFLSSLLLWVVIFNHKAESPTFVIGMCGAALWGITEASSLKKTVLLWFVFVLTGLAATDIFPPYVRLHIIQPFCLKALPCIVLWCYITWKLIAGKKFDAAGAEVS